MESRDKKAWKVKSSICLEIFLFRLEWAVGLALLEDLLGVAGEWEVNEDVGKLFYASVCRKFLSLTCKTKQFL